MDSFLSYLFHVKSYMRESKKWFYVKSNPREYGEYLASKKKKHK